MAYVSRIAKGEPLTYPEMDGNFQEMDAQFVAAEGFALDAQGSAILAQNAVDSAQGIIDDAVEQYEFAVEDNANRIRNIEFGDGPYPSLDLLFTGAKSVDPRIVFERATPKWVFNERGILVEVPPNMPAIDYDPATGKCRGLLVEGQATKLMVPSDYPKETPSGLSISGDSIYIGDITLALFIEDDSDGAHSSASSSVSRVAGTTYTESFYAKSSGRRVYVFSSSAVWGGTTSARFNLDDGTVENTTNATAKMEYIGGGVWRCQYTVTAVENGSTSWRYYLHDGSSFGYQGDELSGVYIGGLQSEVGSTPTSYIPTEDSQVTRANDDAIISGDALSSVLNKNEGVLFLDYVPHGPIGASPNVFAMGLTDGSSSNRITFGESYTNGPFGNFFWTTEGVNGVVSAGTYPEAEWGKRIRVALSWSGQDYALVADGNVLRSGTSSTPFPDVTKLTLGGSGFHGSSRRMNCTFSRAVIYPRALTIEQLQALTSI